MNIGKAAREVGLSVKTLRYYANLGLVTPEQDPRTGYRLYRAEHIAKLQFIGKARRFDFSINECRELLSLYEDKSRPSAEVKRITLDKIATLDQKLAELLSLKQQLETLAENCQGNHRPDCPILDALSNTD